MTEEKILDRIQKLLDKAMSTEFQAEQDALLQKADALMMQYSVDQIQLQQRAKTDPTIKGQTIEFRIVTVLTQEVRTEAGNEIAFALGSLFHTLATHFHCRPITGRTPQGERMAMGESGVVGYPSDIDFLEMLFVQLKMHMLSNLSPTMNPSVSWIENLANFKNCGRKWKDIHYEIRFHPEYPWYGEEWVRKIGVTYTSRYKKFCEEHGIERVTTSSPETWRSDFIAGYVSRIRTRLIEMRRQTINEGDDNLPVLLKDKDGEVLEEFYNLYPSQRPHPDTCQCNTCEAMRKPLPRGGYGRTRIRYRNTGAMNAGGKVANTADLSGTGGKVRSGSQGELK